jgi:hypothetical protein
LAYASYRIIRFRVVDGDGGSTFWRQDALHFSIGRFSTNFGSLDVVEGVED